MRIVIYNTLDYILPYIVFFLLDKKIIVYVIKLISIIANQGHHCIWNIRQTDQEDLNNLELDQIYEQAQTPQNGTPSFCTGPPGTLGGRSQGGTTNPSHAQQTSFQASSGPSSAQATPQNRLF